MAESMLLLFDNQTYKLCGCDMNCSLEGFPRSSVLFVLSTMNDVREKNRACNHLTVDLFLSSDGA